MQQITEEWGKDALGLSKIDHAIGIRVEETRRRLWTMVADMG
jgi:hypothetical protein